MEELRRLIDELKVLLGVKPGDRALTSEDAGDAGQMLDDLIYDQDGSAWKSLEDNDRRDREYFAQHHPNQAYDELKALPYRVQQSAEHYLGFLKARAAK